MSNAAASFSLRGCRVPSTALFTAKHLTVFGLFRIALSKRKTNQVTAFLQLDLNLVFLGMQMSERGKKGRMSNAETCAETTE